MIRKRWPNKIVSDEGFGIVFLNKDTILYEEGNKKLTLNSELLPDGGYVIYKDSIMNWDPPHNDSTISQSERDQILVRIRKLLGAKNIKLEIIGSSIFSLF